MSFPRSPRHRLPAGSPCRAHVPAWTDVLALVTDCEPWSRAVTVGAHLAAGQALIGETQDNNASLLVIDAHSHSRMRKRIDGEATRHVLARSALPIFLRH